MEPVRCNIHQLKEQGYKEKEDPGENMNNSESNMNREEHSRHQEPTKEDELEGLIKQAMLQKAG